MNDQPTRQQRLAAEAETASNEAWAQWSSDIAARLAWVEMRVIALVGGPNGETPDGSDPVLGPIIASFVDDERQERAAAVSKLADAWTERLEAEIATLDERLNAKVFDLAAVRQFKNKLTKLATDLQSETTEALQTGDAKIAEVRDAVAALSRKRDVHALSARLALLERALPKPAVTIVDWSTDLEAYTITPVMSDGRKGAKLDLYPLLEKLAADLADTRR